MSTSKIVDIVLMDDEDVPTCFKILSDSFGHDAPFVDVYFPNHDTLAGQVQGSNRLVAWKRSAPESKFLKAVISTERDGASEERIIGFCIWTYMQDIPPQKIEQAENVEEVWPDMTERQFMAGLWEEYVKPRTQAVKDAQGKGIYVLELLAVHPDYQRMGAGTALVEWGIHASDQCQVKAVVESTPAGRRVYERCGMRAEIEKMNFDVGEEFSNRVKPRLIFMTREPV
ncbi:hypothetical protein O1611_g2607 [Lasiodiplodia mahajangana]|uniref:Uncharacterized protein n=1 Tax=Lasiodiplodia mahajangana TaxID=1108764 RepID=A0ACC2JUZ0_9PEZI|nr:hypothetical protein O1611_g2607 [Lasiodiplodia mahajangana]